MVMSSMWSACLASAITEASRLGGLRSIPFARRRVTSVIAAIRANFLSFAGITIQGACRVEVRANIWSMATSYSAHLPRLRKSS